MLAILAGFLYLVHRLVNSRFGMVMRAAKSNDARTRALGFSPYPYKLAAFVIAGAMCGVAGALLVNQTAYLTPEFMNWTRSGEIMFMVILGGIATLIGPVLGAAALLLLEDLLAALDRSLADHPRADPGAGGAVRAARAGRPAARRGAR